MLTHDEAILIVGITGTLGGAIKDALENAGYTNVFGSTTSLEKCSETVFHFDFEADPNLDAIAAALRTRGLSGSLALAVNAIGISGLVDLSSDRLRQTQRIVNLNLAFPMSFQLMMAKHLKNGGAVGHMGSMSGRIPAPYLEVYGTSKAGLREFCRAFGSGIKPDISAVHFEMGNFGGDMANDVVAQLDAGAITDMAVAAKFRMIAARRLTSAADVRTVAKRIVDVLVSGPRRWNYVISPDARSRVVLASLGLAPAYRFMMKRVLKSPV